jgi:hypothetical protein
MGAAEIIAFEEVRARQPWNLLRQQLHERFDQWLDTLEQQWPEPPSTFPEGTAMVWDVRQQLTGGITETIVAHVHRGEHGARRALVHSVVGCCGRASSSAARSKRWGDRYSWSDPLSTVGRVAWATIPSMQQWAWCQGANSSICKKPRRTW